MSWRVWWLSMTCCVGLFWWVEAAQIPSPPPLPTEPVAEQQYLQKIADNFHVLSVATSNPNGSRRGRLGELIAYNSAGSWRLCVNISTGEGGTTWRCSANALTAP